MLIFTWHILKFSVEVVFYFFLGKGFSPAMEGFQNFHFNEAWDLQIPSLEMGRLGGPVGEEELK